MTNTFGTVHVLSLSPLIGPYCLFIMSCLLSAGTQKAMFLRSIPRVMFSSGSVVSPTLFNREKETAQIIDCLQTRPSINVFLGPPDCGKSVLLTQVLNGLVPDRHIILMDLRAICGASSFLSTLQKMLDPWYRQVTKLEHLSRFITKNTPPHRFWTRYACPILFIDEAHRMNDLIGFDSDRKALKSIISFLVMCTKQVDHFDIVLASSNSFYHRWLTNFIGADQFRTFVIGNLTKDDAKKYWEEHALKQHHHKSFLGTPSFEDAYFACGGNIHSLDKYAAKYYITKGELVPENFHFVIQQRAKLDRALLAESAEWNKTTLLKVMAELIESEKGFLLYNKLCKEFGERVIDSIIKANILHLRPTGTLSYDLDNAPDEAIVTADSPSCALAMKLILKEES